MTRLQDPFALSLEAAVMDWGALAERRRDFEPVRRRAAELERELAGLLEPSGTELTGRERGTEDYPPLAVAPALGAGPQAHLRWMVDPRLGLPEEPFRVWRRIATPADLRPAGVARRYRVPGGELVLFDAPQLRIVLPVTAGAQGATVRAVSRTPVAEGSGPAREVPASTTATLDFAAGRILGVQILGGGLGGAVRGVPAEGHDELPGWQEVEHVGLPVAWPEVPVRDLPQGFVAALRAPEKAALARLLRGAPPFGWDPLLSTGNAPAWEAPHPVRLLDELADPTIGILPRLRGVLGLPGAQQAASRDKAAFAPQSAGGASIPGGDAEFQPLLLALLGAGSDPFLALALGFGTAIPAPPLGRVVVGAGFFGGVWDWMVTARWPRGPDRASAPVEYVAFAPGPNPALRPPAPEELRVEGPGQGVRPAGLLRPGAVDGDWQASLRLGWRRSGPPVRVASLAATRIPAATPEPLLERRPSGGWRPIAATLPDTGLPQDRVAVIDTGLRLPDAGLTQAYAAAQQDIFGLWSPWAEVTGTAPAPPAGVPRIAAARLDVLPGTPCPATLEVEMLVDWSVRSPRAIRLVGRAFNAARRNSLPPDPSLPAGLDRGPGQAGAAVDILFNGDTPAAPAGATIEAIDPRTGEALAAPAGVVRRYRLRLPGFAFAFPAGHAGLTLFARLTEARAPNRTGAWSEMALAMTSDPRPPFVPPMPHVILASLPDAAGECHARLAWSGPPGATYVIYEASETAILAARGEPEPGYGPTLDARRAALAAAYARAPDEPQRRAPFTRWTGTPVAGNSLDVALPRGTSAIHAFVVIGRNAAGIEGAFPADPEALTFIAAPRRMVPAPPTLEVRPGDAPGTVTVAIGCREGPRVARLQLFRSRLPEAAASLDTMGPPVAEITESDGTWQVARRGPADAGIATASGSDAPAPSWKEVWYRACAWSADDPTRGGRAARSPGSSAISVLVPPPGAPELGPPGWQPGPPGTARLRWASTAPVPRTRLGPHRLEVEGFGALRAHHAADLDELPGQEPAAPGPWRDAQGYQLRLERDPPDGAGAVAIRLFDPLGRMTERMIELGAGEQPVPLAILSAIATGTVTTTLLRFSAQAPAGAVLTVRADGRREQIPRPPPLVGQAPLESIGRQMQPLGDAGLAILRMPIEGGDAQGFQLRAPPQYRRFLVALATEDGRRVQRMVEAR